MDFHNSSLTREAGKGGDPGSGLAGTGGTQCSCSTRDGREGADFGAGGVGSVCRRR